MITAVMAFCLIMISLLILSCTRWIWTYNQARRRGLLPLDQKATLFDVRYFVDIGERDLAIYVYSDLFRCSYRKARKAVDELERGLQEKNSER